MNTHKLTLDAYVALLHFSDITPTDLAAAYVFYPDIDIEAGTAEAEIAKLLAYGVLTEEGARIAQAICTPQKTIVATNSTFGRVPLCVFNLFNNRWYVTEFDHSAKCVNIISDISLDEIFSAARDVLVGSMTVAYYSPFTMTLTNDEMALYNTCLLLMGNRARGTGGVLSPMHGRFTIEDLLCGKEFATIAMTEDVSNSNNFFEMMKDSDRCQRAFTGLLAKEIFVATEKPDIYKPGVVMFYKLAPQHGAINVTYYDVTSGVGHKYYVFPDSILEITVDKFGLTFTQARDIDLSLFSVHNS